MSSSISSSDVAFSLNSSLRLLLDSGSGGEHPLEPDAESEERRLLEERSERLRFLPLGDDENADRMLPSEPSPPPSRSLFGWSFLLELLGNGVLGRLKRPEEFRTERRVVFLSVSLALSVVRDSLCCGRRSEALALVAPPVYMGQPEDFGETPPSSGRDSPAEQGPSRGVVVVFSFAMVVL